MSTHSFSDYVKATRYWSFAVSAMPVVVSMAYLCSVHMISWNWLAVVKFVLCLVGVVTLHAAGNVLSDYFDYRTGVDNEQAFAVPNLVFHEFEPKQYLTLSIILFAVGIIIGLALTFMCGVSVFYIGLAGVVLTALYSLLKYHALGDLDIFLIFSLLIMIGTGYVLTGSLVTRLMLLSIPVGTITVSVLHANNTVDIQSDGAAGIITFAMLIGHKASCVLYRIYMLVPFICILAYVFTGLLHPLVLLSIFAAIQAFGNIRLTISQGGLQGMDLASSRLQLSFSGLLSVGLIISSFL